MTHHNGLLRGRKFSGRHTTVIEAAIPIVDTAKKLPQVSKIVLSEIVPIRSGPMRLRFAPVPAGLRMVVRGPSAQQLFFVYTSDPTGVEQALYAAWNRERR